MHQRSALLIVLALCSAAPGPGPAGGAVTGRVLLVNNGKSVTPVDVFVYLEEIHPKHRNPKPGDGVKAQIRQEKEQFTPHALVVPKGAEVVFPNYDLKEHNVFSPSEDMPFDIGRYNQDKKGKSKVFPVSGELSVYCDIHPLMWAKLKIVDSAWIAPVGSDGKFVVTNVPPGKYKVTAWVHDSKEVKSDTIVVTEAGTVDAGEVHLQLGEFKLDHLRWDGTPYPCQPGYKC
ncbi:MAG: uncharacterized protein JWO36_5646 [Myxococcales bacterium]|nr:uncharacterized protein [Myxococcales bacterium]